MYPRFCQRRIYDSNLSISLKSLGPAPSASLVTYIFANQGFCRTPTLPPMRLNKGTYYVLNLQQNFIDFSGGQTVRNKLLKSKKAREVRITIFELLIEYQKMRE